MDRDNAIKSLKEDFPDMSQSVIGDVLGVYKGDKSAAAVALGGIDGETKRENEKKIKELRDLFPFATDQMCKEILTSTNWDVEAAIVPLFTKGEELKKKPAKRKASRLPKNVKRRQKNNMNIYLKCST